MKFLKYLYYKYYRFQIKVGNSDIAPFSAMVFIVFSIEIYYMGFLSLFPFIFSKEKLEYFHDFIKMFSFLLPIFLIILLYFVLVHKKKYKRIIEEFENKDGYKGSLKAILFPIIGFIFTMLVFLFTILQNQGKL